MATLKLRRKETHQLNHDRPNLRQTGMGCPKLLQRTMQQQQKFNIFANKGWSGGAMVLGKLPVPGVLLT